MPTRISFSKSWERPTADRIGLDKNVLQVFTSAAHLGKGKVVIHDRELLREQHMDSVIDHSSSQPQHEISTSTTSLLVL